MSIKEQKKIETVQKKSTELNLSETKEEDKAVEQVIKGFMNDIDITKVTPQTLKDLKFVLEDNSFISKQRAKAEVRKFVSKYTSEYIDKKLFLSKNKTEEDYKKFLSKFDQKRADAEYKKFLSGYKINRDDTNSLHDPTNKDRRENLKEKLNKVSKEENSSPKRAAVSQDLQHKQDNPLHR